MTRRALLRAGSLGAATVGAVSAFPGLLAGVGSASPEVTGVASDVTADAPAIEGPIVAHIVNAASGDISLYVGDKEIAVRDTGLVQRLLNAAR